MEDPCSPCGKQFFGLPGGYFYPPVCPQCPTDPNCENYDPGGTVAPAGQSSFSDTSSHGSAQFIPDVDVLTQSSGRFARALAPTGGSRSSFGEGAGGGGGAGGAPAAGQDAGPSTALIVGGVVLVGALGIGAYFLTRKR